VFKGLIHKTIWNQEHSLQVACESLWTKVTYMEAKVLKKK